MVIKVLMRWAKVVRMSILAKTEVLPLCPFLTDKASAGENCAHRHLGLGYTVST